MKGNVVCLEEVSMGHVTETGGEEDGQRRRNTGIARERRRRRRRRRSGGREGGRGRGKRAEKKVPGRRKDMKLFNNTARLCSLFLCFRKIIILLKC